MSKSNSSSRDLISEADGVQYVRRCLQSTGTGAGKLQLLDLHEERLRSEVSANARRGKKSAEAKLAGARGAVAYLEDMEVSAATIAKAQEAATGLEPTPATDSPAKAQVAATGPVNDSAKPSPGEAND
jgi:hypothetical protein